MNYDETTPPSQSPEMGTPPDLVSLATAFQQFVETVAKLRGPDGCPWDRKQTLESIKPYTLEETYELLDAIDSGDDAAIIEELGDVLLQVVLDAQIAADEGRFDLIPVVEQINAKLIRRHPHVFGDENAESVEDVHRHWEREKRAEKQGSERKSVLSGVPTAYPALAEARKLSSKAAKVGFDWPRREMLFDKLNEEVAELAEELFADGKVPEVPASVAGDIQPDEPISDARSKSHVEEEIGDILFVVANIARRWQIDPEQALRKSNKKFAERFQYIEQKLAEQGHDIHKATLDEMEALYQQGKAEAAESSST